MTLEPDDRNRLNTFLSETSIQNSQEYLAFYDKLKIEYADILLKLSQNFTQGQVFRGFFSLAYWPCNRVLLVALKNDPEAFDSYKYNNTFKLSGYSQKGKAFEDLQKMQKELHVLICQVMDDPLTEILARDIAESFKLG